VRAKAAGGRDEGLARGVVLVVEQLRRTVPGGIGTYTRALVAGIASLAEADRPRCRLYASRPRGTADPLTDLGFPVETSPWPAAALVAAWGVGLGRVGGGAAIVHATSTAFPPAAAPLTVAIHDLAWRQVPEAYPAHGRRWHERALRRAARRAACVIVPSEATARQLRDAGLGVDDERIAVVEEGSDHLGPPDAAATRGVLARLGVEGEYLLAVGTREPRKNLTRLLAAYTAARQRHELAMPLVVVGPPGWGDATTRPAGVVFSGPVADPVLAGLYATARLVVYVPLVEGFGLPVVEAMRAGTPVVASAVPSSAGAAHEVDPYDVDGIAAGLVAVATEEDLRTRLVAAGFARVAPLTWRAAAEGHLAVWRRLAGAAR
jgi:glycosyltransferase involved in cell wall biosynthesis